MRRRKTNKLNEQQIRKRQIRASAEWAELRDKVKKEQKVDLVSLKTLSRSFNLHHLSQDERYYDDLSRERFIALNDYSHRTIHYIYDIVKREGDYAVLDRIKDIIERMHNITLEDSKRE